MEIGQLLGELKDREVSMMDQDKYRRSSILIPLIHVGSEIHLLYEVRSMQLRTQPGDICFPGGRMDVNDANPVSCAIRETSEELGIRSSDLDHIIPLDYMISGKGLIHSFAGQLKDSASIKLNEAEVAEVFTVPLDFFLDQEPKVYKVSLNIEPEKDFPFELIQNGKGYDFRKREMEELFYEYNGYVIWGLTAKITYHFVQLIKENRQRNDL